MPRRESCLKQWRPLRRTLHGGPEIGAAEEKNPHRSALTKPGGDRFPSARHWRQTIARLTEFPTADRFSKGAYGLRVGDTRRVRLTAVDSERGFIDLERVP